MNRTRSIYPHYVIAWINGARVKNIGRPDERNKLTNINLTLERVNEAFECGWNLESKARTRLQYIQHDIIRAMNRAASMWPGGKMDVPDYITEHWTNKDRLIVPANLCHDSLKAIDYFLIKDSRHAQVALKARGSMHRVRQYDEATFLNDPSSVLGITRKITNITMVERFDQLFYKINLLR